MTELLDRLAAPARRALDSIGVRSLDDVASHTRGEIASLHGMGPTALRQLEEALAEIGLSFTTEQTDPCSATPLKLSKPAR